MFWQTAVGKGLQWRIFGKSTFSLFYLKTTYNDTGCLWGFLMSDMITGDQLGMWPSNLQSWYDLNRLRAVDSM